MRRTVRAGRPASVLVGLLLAVGACSAAGAPTDPVTAAVPTSAVPTTAVPTAAVPTTAVPTTAAPTPSSSVPTLAPTASPSRIRSPLPDVHVPGVNDPSCRSAERPVVLLPGTFSTVQSNFTALAAALQADGRCVYGLNYGLAGVAPVRDSASAAAGFVQDVRAATGADQVDVVGFSQGGLVLRTALRLDGLAPAVATAVLIAPSFHGSTADLLTGVPAAACPACADQTAGSALLTELDAGGDLDGQVRYATISSRDDTVVTPVDGQSPVGPADRVRSLVIQDRCPQARVSHLDLPADPGVVGWLGAALDSDGRPEPTAYRCP